VSAKPQPLGKLSSKALVPYLYDSNGWYRDMAQRLLVERKDLSVVDQLKSVVRRPHILGKLHALWTLDGLKANDKSLLMEALKDSADIVSNTAIRMLEPFADNTFGDEMIRMLPSASNKQLLQLVLSARYLSPTQSFPIYKYALEAQHPKVNSSDEPGESDSDLAANVIKDAVLSGLEGKELAFTRALFTQLKWEQPGRFGFMVFNDLATAITKRRDPNEISELFSFVNKYEGASIMIHAIVTQGLGKWQPLKLASKPAIPSKTGEQLVKVIDNMFEWPGHKVDVNAVKSTAKLSPDEQELFAKGRQQYLSVCAGCHGNNGEGVKRMAPPLAGSEWVLGDQRRLTLLVLHGIEGPLEVAGKRYETPEILPTMPSHTTMDDGNILSILIYIRNEWGNDAGGVSRRTVGRLRHTTQGRIQPWTAKGLDEHMKKIDTVKIN
jgi:mono/diheme cytochrome c family protein